MRKFIKEFLLKFKKVNLSKMFTFFIVVFVCGLFFYQNRTIKPSATNDIVPSVEGLKFKESKPKKIKVKNFSLYIPKLGISAPIIPYTSGVEKKYLKALERGVVHFKGSSLPGQGGNIVIFGHSSYYYDRPGNYKDIFENLPDIQKGDRIKIVLNSKEYQYQVRQKKVVNPESIEYLKETKKERLTLITCVPPGTTQYRLIVLAWPIKKSP